MFFQGGMVDFFCLLGMTSRFTAGRQSARITAVSMTSTEDQPFQFIRHLGKGGFGTVDLCRDLRLQRDVAIKTLKLQTVSSAMDADEGELLAEARHQATLNHPNIVQVYSLTQYRGGLGIVMEYVSGGTLLQQIQQNGRLTESVGIGIMQEVAKGLQYLHSRGVCHGDLSAKNILLTSGNQPRLVDFGLSLPGQAGGTPGYRPPEWASGTADPRGDIYSWGACLYLVLTGQNPPPDFQFPQISASSLTQQILRRATMSDAEQRFRDVNELLQALQPQAPSRALPEPPAFRISRDHFSLTFFEWASAGACDSDLDRLTDYVQLRALRVPRHLSQLTRLQSLKLTSRGFTDAVIPQLQLMTELRDLDLSHSSVTDEGLKLLAGQPGLRTLSDLSLQGCAISNGGLQHLSSLPLRTLHLGQTRITDEVIPILGSLTELREVRGLSETFLSSAGQQQVLSVLQAGHQRRG